MPPSARAIWTAPCCNCLQDEELAALQRAALDSARRVIADQLQDDGLKGVCRNRRGAGGILGGGVTSGAEFRPAHFPFAIERATGTVRNQRSFCSLYVCQVRA